MYSSTSAKVLLSAWHVDNIIVIKTGLHSLTCANNTTYHQCFGTLYSQTENLKEDAKANGLK